MVHMNEVQVPITESSSILLLYLIPISVVKLNRIACFFFGHHMFVNLDWYCTGPNSCVYYSTAEELIVLFHFIPQALRSRDKAPAGTLALCQTPSVLFQEAITNKAAAIEAFVWSSAG